MGSDLSVSDHCLSFYFTSYFESFYLWMSETQYVSGFIYLLHFFALFNFFLWPITPFLFT